MPEPITDRELNLHHNLLLRGLPEDELRQLSHRVEAVHVEQKEMIFDVDAPIDWLYFPVSGVLSQVATVDGETVIEVATIGREGVAGLPAFLGAKASPNRVFCQIPTDAFRLPTAQLPPLLTADGAMQRVLHHYTQATIVLLAQTVACNRSHSMEERAARWLLMTRDRVDEDTFPLTQEFLAQMLGVRRATVSVTAGVLQAAGLIRYTRGQITLVDRARLEEAACECYGIIRGEFDRLLDG